MVELEGLRREIYFFLASFPAEPGERIIFRMKMWSEPTITLFQGSNQMQKIIRRAQQLIIRHEINYCHNCHEKEGFTLNYDSGVYRDVDLRKLIIKSIPHFALTKQELHELYEREEISELNSMAWKRISKAKFDKKGDYGEALLFILLQSFYKNERIVTKVKLRSTRAEQVKGYDCANFTYEDDRLTLWLGEAKFYQKFSEAIDAVIEELEKHTKREYIEGEFQILINNCELNSKNSLRNRLVDMLDGTIPFSKLNLKFPILLTCSCKMLERFSDENSDVFKEFINRYFISKFSQIEKKVPQCLLEFDIIFFILPLYDVQNVKSEIDKYERLMENNL